MTCFTSPIPAESCSLSSSEHPRVGSTAYTQYKVAFLRPGGRGCVRTVYMQGSRHRGAQITRVSTTGPGEDELLLCKCSESLIPIRCIYTVRARLRPARSCSLSSSAHPGVGIPAYAQSKRTLAPPAGGRRPYTAYMQRIRHRGAQITRVSTPGCSDHESEHDRCRIHCIHTV